MYSFGCHFITLAFILSTIPCTMCHFLLPLDWRIIFDYMNIYTLFLFSLHHEYLGTFILGYYKQYSHEHSPMGFELPDILGHVDTMGVQFLHHNVSPCIIVWKKNAMSYFLHSAYMFLQLHLQCMRVLYSPHCCQYSLLSLLYNPLWGSTIFSSWFQFVFP